MKGKIQGQLPLKIMHWHSFNKNTQGFRYTSAGRVFLFHSKHALHHIVSWKCAILIHFLMRWSPYSFKCTVNMVQTRNQQISSYAMIHLTCMYFLPFFFVILNWLFFLEHNNYDKQTIHWLKRWNILVKFWLLRKSGLKKQKINLWKIPIWYCYKFHKEPYEST